MGIGSCGTEQRSLCLKEAFGLKAYQLVFVAVQLSNPSLLRQLHLCDDLLVFRAGFGFTSEGQGSKHRQMLCRPRETEWLTCLHCILHLCCTACIKSHCSGIS